MLRCVHAHLTCCIGCMCVHSCHWLVLGASDTDNLPLQIPMLIFQPCQTAGQVCVCLHFICYIRCMHMHICWPLGASNIKTLITCCLALANSSLHLLFEGGRHQFFSLLYNNEHLLLVLELQRVCITPDLAYLISASIYRHCDWYWYYILPSLCFMLFSLPMLGII